MELVNRELKYVDRLKYLGNVLTREIYCTMVNKRRIGMVKEVFNRKKSF
jgi:hypothetical protein